MSIATASPSPRPRSRHNTASGAYSLKAMTVVVVFFLLLVLGYRAWPYYVYRRHASRDEFLASPQEGAPQEVSSCP